MLLSDILTLPGEFQNFSLLLCNKCSLKLVSQYVTEASIGSKAAIVIHANGSLRRICWNVNVEMYSFTSRCKMRS